MNILERREANGRLKRKTYKIYTATEVQTNGDPTEKGVTGDDLCPDTGCKRQESQQKYAQVVTHTEISSLTPVTWPHRHQEKTRGHDLFAFKRDRSEHSFIKVVPLLVLQDIASVCVLE